MYGKGARLFFRHETSDLFEENIGTHPVTEVITRQYCWECLLLPSERAQSSSGSDMKNFLRSLQSYSCQESFAIFRGHYLRVATNRGWRLLD